MIIVNGFQMLTIITKSSILDNAAVLDPPLALKLDLSHDRSLIAKVASRKFI